MDNLKVEKSLDKKIVQKLQSVGHNISIVDQCNWRGTMY